MGLPSGYKQLEYIRSSGTQYINTGVSHSSSNQISLQAEVAYSTLTPAHQIMGFTGNAGNGIGLATSTWWETTSIAAPKAGTKYTIDWGVNGTAWYRSVNGVTVSGTRVTYSYSSNMFLFAALDSAGSTVMNYFCQCKLYRAKVVVNGSVVRDYVPCQTKLGVVGLYDTVNGAFYSDAAGGNFISSAIDSGAEYDLTQTIPENPKPGDKLNCPYSGSAISLTLKKGTYQLECWGAQGGSYSSYYGGTGGYSVGTITLPDDTVIYLYSGGQPATVSTNRVAVPGGFNGGGNGFNRYYSSTYTYGQGGGGASDIRIGTDSLYARVIVAGGGGGSASVNALTTKYGGGTSGGSPQSGYGATQTGAGTNGAFGQGGSATTSGNNYKYGSGGGGGGWYGGGACSSYSDSTNYRGYNGGGSGFVWTGANAPAEYLLSSDYYLQASKTVAGNTAFLSPTGASETGHTGNGYVRITVIDAGLETPQNLRQISTEYFSIGIAWDAVEDAAGYRIYKNGTLVADTTETTYTDTDIQPTETHVYTVIAYNAGGESEPAKLTAYSKEGFVKIAPVITAASITPQKTTINSTVFIQIFAEDIIQILEAYYYNSGDIFSGEV